MGDKKGKKAENKNWTESDINNFRYFVGADFIDQLQASFESMGMTQRGFANLVNVSEGRVSQVFNDPGNLTLDTMIKWGRAAGLKTGVVLYNDGDKKNIRGPLSGSIFVECWKRLGAPIEWPNEVTVNVHSYGYENLHKKIVEPDAASQEGGAAFVRHLTIVNGNRWSGLQKWQAVNETCEEALV